MSKQSKFSKKEIDKRFEDLFKNETRYGIVMAIRTFGSMNIKLLSRIMGKAESTIHHHIEEMKKEPQVIIIDTEKTSSSRGKYYTLSNITNQKYPKDKESVYEEEIPTIMERMNKLNDEELAKVMLFRLMSQPDFGYMSKSIRRSLSYYHNIENFIVTSFERSEESLKQGLKPKNLLYPFGTTTKLSLDIEVSRPRHSIEIGMVISNFFAQLVKLKNKIRKEMDEEGIPEEERIRIYYQFFGGEVEDFEFEKDKTFDLQDYVKPVKEIIEKLYHGIEEN